MPDPLGGFLCLTFTDFSSLCFTSVGLMVHGRCAPNLAKLDRTVDYLADFDRCID
jgi:hypothetical protein